VRSNAIPVIMYHSVGRTMANWKWSFLTVPWRTFEDHLKQLKRSGYRSVTLEQLHAHMSGQALLPERSVVLTFDDGFLDNWAFAAPLLRRYGFSATVFVNPEFVDPRDIVRPCLDDVWNSKATYQELEYHGFMSWPELKRISEDGTFSVQSHLMTHTWYPVNDTVVDFHHPQDDYYWLEWNTAPEMKPFYLQEETTASVAFGAPVYEHKKSLAATRYFPDHAETEHLADYVAQSGGRVFFDNDEWRQLLFAELESFREKHTPNQRMETASEQQERVLGELQHSKRILSEKLNTEVDYMAWPGGGYNDETFRLAQTIYKATTINSSDARRNKNQPGDDPQKISRIGAPYLEAKGQIYYPGGKYLTAFLDEFRGSFFARKKRQLYKLGLLATAAGRVPSTDRE